MHKKGYKKIANILSIEGATSKFEKGKKNISKLWFSHFTNKNDSNEKIFLPLCLTL